MTGQEIRDLRSTLGLTQVDLARKVGAHPNTVARWEREEMTPTGIYLISLKRFARRARKTK